MTNQNPKFRQLLPGLPGMFSPAINGRVLYKNNGKMGNLVNCIAFLTHDAILTMHDKDEFEKTKPILFWQKTT
jgi:hypothetical protein